MSMLRAQTSGRENRRQERYQVKRQITGQMYLRSQGERYPIERINDVSSSGISVFNSAMLNAPTPIVIEYSDSDASLEVTGTLVWCAPNNRTEDNGKFILGIELLSPLFLLSALHRH